MTTTKSIKLGLLVFGIGSIVTGVGLRSVPCALVVGGLFSLGLLYLVSLAEPRVTNKK